MYRVTEEIRFSYGHRLMDYVGRCARVHGHNARVEVVLEAATLDRRGFVMDFDELHAAAGRWVDEALDHRLFLRSDDPLVPLFRSASEDVVALDENPTAEVFARMIFERLKSSGLPVVAVRFWETDSSVASYEPPAT